MRCSCLLLACAAFVLSGGCGQQDWPKELVFWHTQAQENAALLQQLVNEYNATNPPMRVALVFMNDYDTLFKGVRAEMAAGRLPDLVVAYESMVAEYIAANAIVPLDDYINDPEIGLSKESLDDIFPSILENNRYPVYGNKFYTFPFTKSVLMMYYNQDMLKEAGFEQPPRTWKEFQDQCLAVKEKLKKGGYALSVDASTFDGMVMSFGGRLVSEDRTRALFDSPESIAALKVIYDMVKAGTAYQISSRDYGDRKDFAGQMCAFMIRSSTTRPFLEADIRDKFRWDMAPIPHGEGKEPVTVLFGANIAVMRTTPERQRAAWQFIKFFASKEATAKWAVGTGYLPVRKSAAEMQQVQEFFRKNPRNRRAFDALAIARPEPGVIGWQSVRRLIEEAESDAIGGRIAPEEIARRLAQQATAALAKARE